MFSRATEGEGGVWDCGTQHGAPTEGSQVHQRSPPGNLRLWPLPSTRKLHRYSVYPVRWFTSNEQQGRQRLKPQSRGAGRVVRQPVRLRERGESRTGRRSWKTRTGEPTRDPGFFHPPVPPPPRPRSKDLPALPLGLLGNVMPLLWKEICC